MLEHPLRIWFLAKVWQCLVKLYLPFPLQTTNSLVRGRQLLLIFGLKLRDSNPQPRQPIDSLKYIFLQNSTTAPMSSSGEV